MDDRKRKRPTLGEAEESSCDQSSSEDDFHDTTSRNKKQRLSCVRPPNLQYPPSFYDGWTPPRRVISEEDALDNLLQACPPTADEEDYTYITLSDFCAYRPSDSAWYPGTMAPLSDLLTRPGDYRFMFDGILSRGSASYFVKNVTFKIVSVEGYDKDAVSVRDGLFLQSESCGKTTIWYKLSTPATHYRRFYDNYIWLADFTKHFICYISEHSRVRLTDFKQRFQDWLEILYKNSETFTQWRIQFPRKDFRMVVVNNHEYLWKEATSYGVDENSHNREQPLWKEIDPRQLEAVPKQPMKETKTVVTPYVFDLFGPMYFGDQLETRSPATTMTWQSDVVGPQAIVTKTTTRVMTGDVICLARDESGHWKDKETTWYAYVHAMEMDDVRKDYILHLFWLYRPSETTCGAMRYPYKNELFFSDHCNCACAKSARVYASDVTEKVSVVLFAKSASTPSGVSHFIRQTYITEDDMNCFVSLKKSHLRCDAHHGKSKRPKSNHRIGETVLIRTSRRALLEPVEIVSIGHNHMRVRKFVRRQRDLYEVARLPNELVYTHIIKSISPGSIIRKCHIRFYLDGEDIPAPYSYGGVGDCWIITGQSSSSNLSEVVPVSDISKISMLQGFDPRTISSPLQVLDLFCGGGSFGRGVEEGGVAKIKWACDLDEFAIHTKKANLKSLDDTHLFCGSAVDYFAQAAAASASGDSISELIAKVGMVDMIIAGSPCQGFSLAQPSTSSARSRKNASMIALVVAFIDVYRPKYALLENVFGMTRKFGPNKDEDVFAQIVCALVGLGYQVQYHIVDAFSHASPQNRSRIFISIAAPGLTPMQSPPITHSSPPTVKTRRIGLSLAGVKFGNRQFETTPFSYISSAKATKDLPPIGDGQVGICIPYPDHRLSRTLNIKGRVVLPWIPIYPYEHGFAKALQQKLLPQPILDMYADRIRSMPLQHLKIFRRAHPGHVFDTCTTACSPDDARDGRWIHWAEQRPISIMEAKRAQSFPDDEVLIGAPAQQWKLIGNAVSRHVAAAWGVSLREAVLQNARIELPHHPVISSFNATVVEKEQRVLRTDHSVLESSTSSVTFSSKKVALSKTRLTKEALTVVNLPSASAPDSSSESDSDSDSITFISETIKVKCHTTLQSRSGQRPKALQRVRQTISLSQSYVKLDASSSESGTIETEDVSTPTEPSRLSSASSFRISRPLTETSEAATITTPTKMSSGRSSAVPIQWPKSNSTPETLLARIVARGAATYAATNGKRKDEKLGSTNGYL